MFVDNIGTQAYSCGSTFSTSTVHGSLHLRTTLSQPSSEDRQEYFVLIIFPLLRGGNAASFCYVVLDIRIYLW